MDRTRRPNWTEEEDNLLCSIRDEVFRTLKPDQQLWKTVVDRMNVEGEALGISNRTYAESNVRYNYGYLMRLEKNEAQGEDDSGTSVKLPGYHEISVTVTPSAVKLPALRNKGYLAPAIPAHHTRTNSEPSGLPGKFEEYKTPDQKMHFRRDTA